MQYLDDAENLARAIRGPNGAQDPVHPGGDAPGDAVF